MSEPRVLNKRAAGRLLRCLTAVALVTSLSGCGAAGAPSSDDLERGVVAAVEATGLDVLEVSASSSLDGFSSIAAVGVAIPTETLPAADLRVLLDAVLRGGADRTDRLDLVVVSGTETFAPIVDLGDAALELGFTDHALDAGSLSAATAEVRDVLGERP